MLIDNIGWSMNGVKYCCVFAFDNCFSSYDLRVYMYIYIYTYTHIDAEISSWTVLLIDDWFFENNETIEINQVKHVVYFLHCFDKHIGWICCTVLTYFLSGFGVLKSRISLRVPLLWWKMSTGYCFLWDLPSWYEADFAISALFSLAVCFVDRGVCRQTPNCEMYRILWSSIRQLVQACL